MIKILFFIEKFGGGGAEKVLRDLVNHMDQSKFDITVQSVWPYEEGKLLNHGIRYKSVYSARNALTEKKYRIEAALGLTYPLHIKDDYDIEVAYLECGPTKVIASSTNQNAKKVAWVHCDLAQKMTDPVAFAKKALRWYQKYDSVVCVSQNVKDSFDRLFGFSEKTTVLYNTVNDSEIREKAEVFVPEMPTKRRLTVVTVGRLMHQKGFDRLLYCHKKLIENGFAYDLWILGEGEDRPQLESFIVQNGLSDSVRLLGFCRNPYPYIKEADFLVCSSRYEGFSTFVTEGVVLGKPIVTTDCTGMRELLGDSKYGLVVGNSADALLAGMKQMLVDPALRSYYAESAAQRSCVFTARALAAETEAFLEKLLPHQHE